MLAENQLNGSIGNNQSLNCLSEEKPFDLVIITLTLPLWTFITLNLLLLLVHYLRSLQYFKLFDKCIKKNAHFRYDFHVIVGKYSINFNCTDSLIIIDLLDNQLISCMTLQVPTATIFNDSSVFTYSHSRRNLRVITFTIYRRHPIRDIKSIRVAHSCNSQDSRLMIHGVNFYDVTNSENKFFPITSIVKNRGTQWALNTTFEAKNEMSFSQLGCEVYDPFGITIWPTYAELINLIFFIWCSILFFGYLIPVNVFNSSILLHSLTISVISIALAAFICVIHFYLVKSHIVDRRYDTEQWFFMKAIYMVIVMMVSLIFWSVATSQTKACKEVSMKWIFSSLASALAASIIVLSTHYLSRCRKTAIDQTILNDGESLLMKTNSITNIEFTSEDTKIQTTPPHTAKKSSAQKSSGKIAFKNPPKVSSKRQANSKKSNTKTDKRNKKDNHNNNEETLDNHETNSDSAYMKTKNRNSISQYV